MYKKGMLPGIPVPTGKPYPEPPYRKRFLVGIQEFRMGRTALVPVSALAVTVLPVNCPVIQTPIIITSIICSFIEIIITVRIITLNISKIVENFVISRQYFRIY